jgi:ubiquinone/menaquinone biosynthesis C-methylase UbiE
MTCPTFHKSAARAFGIALTEVKPRVADPSAATRAVLDAFTELAPEYEATMDQELDLLWGVSYGAFIDRLIDMVPLDNGVRILDVATGTARIPLQVTRRAPGGFHVVGLDITPAMLVCGRENIRSADRSSRIGLVCGSGLVMPFGACAFDVVTCGLGMHHMPAEELVRQMRRVLSPGGWLLMADVGAPPEWRSFRRKLAFGALVLYFSLIYSRARVRAEMDAIRNLRTASQWHSFLVAADFADITIEEYASFNAIMETNPIRVTVLAVGTYDRYLAARQAEGVDLGHLKPPRMQPSDQIIGRLLEISADPGWETG